MYRSSLLAVLVGSIALFTQACAAEGDATDDSTADISTHGGAVQGQNAVVLQDLLMKAHAPSNTAPGILGIGSHVARVELTTAQGGIAHFISEGGQISTLGGGDLGSLVDAGVAWVDVRNALEAGGAKFTTEQGLHGASSSRMFAKVECSQVVSPSARPSCTVSPITVTESDSSALMKVLTAVNAPSNNPPGLVGVGSRIGRIDLMTAQGGMAHFISEGGSVSTLDGKPLGNALEADVAWATIRDALLDGGLVWKTTQGDHGASSSKMSATVSCTQVVAPSAKPSCIVKPAFN